MALVLYDNPASSNALKVRFLLAELGLEHERRTIAFARPRPAAYLAVNPVGGIPTLVDEDFALAESHAILRYLAAREGRDDLLPGDRRERARLDEFLDRFATTLRPALFRQEAPALGYVAGQGFGAAPGDAEAAARAEAEIRPTLELFDALVGEDAALLGRFTVADCAVAPVLFRTTHSGLDLGPFPRLRGLRDALIARPAFAAAEPVL